jgi:HK97 family phage prohead protease
MRNKEKLYFKDVELRAEDKEGKKVVTGVIPYESKSVPLGFTGFTEIIDRSAFRKTIADNKNIYALFNHDDNKVLGSTRSGTLRLENTDEGLFCHCDLPNTSYGNDAWEIISRGDTKTLSFAFSPIKTEKDKNNVRRLKEVELQEVSFCVPFPAYPETDSSAYLRRINIMKKRNIDVDSISQLLEKEELSEDEVNQIRELVKSLNKIIEENSPEKEKEAVEKEPEETTPREEDTSEKDAEKEAEEIALLETAIELELLDLEAIKEEVTEKEKEEDNE